MTATPEYIDPRRDLAPVNGTRLSPPRAPSRAPLRRWPTALGWVAIGLTAAGVLMGLLAWRY